MTIKYILCPGNIKSRADANLVHVNAKQLAKLYKVSLTECIKMPRDSDLKGWTPPAGAIELHPDPSGIYQLPTTTESNS
jgi:hypothetical protein